MIADKHDHQGNDFSALVKLLHLIILSRNYTPAQLIDAAVLVAKGQVESVTPFSILRSFLGQPIKEESMSRHVPEARPALQPMPRDVSICLAVVLAHRINPDGLTVTGADAFLLAGETRTQIEVAAKTEAEKRFPKDKGWVGIAIRIDPQPTVSQIGSHEVWITAQPLEEKEMEESFTL